MVIKEDCLIEPLIYYGPGGCPKCSTNLWVADTETTLMQLNNDGVPISEETYVKCKAVCPNCGYKTEMVRNKGNYIPYGEFTMIMKKAELKEEINRRMKELTGKRTENPLASSINSQ